MVDPISEATSPHARGEGATIIGPAAAENDFWAIDKVPDESADVAEAH
jgi:hypothetical protein